MCGGAGSPVRGTCPETRGPLPAAVVAGAWGRGLTRGAYEYWEYAQGPVILLSLVCGLALGWQGFFWLGAIRLLYSLHGQCLVNSLTHLGHAEHGDCSKNIWWLEIGRASCRERG